MHPHVVLLADVSDVVEGVESAQHRRATSSVHEERHLTHNTRIHRTYVEHRSQRTNSESLARERETNYIL